MAAEGNDEVIIGELGEIFYYEPNTLPFLISPAFLTSFCISLLTPYLVSPLLWSILLPVNKNPPKSNMYFHTMLTSTIHAIVSALLTSYLLVYGMMGINRVFSKSSLGFMTMQISLGYFVGDFIVCLCDAKLRASTASLIHHVAGIVGLSLSLFFQGKLMFFVVYRLIAEFSTPFVNLRYILSDLQRKDGHAYLFAGFSMLITFVICRIIVIPWHWYEIVTTLVTEEAAVIIPLFFQVWLGGTYLLFDVLNVYWCYKIVRGVRKLVKTRKAI